MRILVVDDNADARELFGSLLERGGHTVVLATDGPRALTAASEHVPDVVVLDIKMPGMDGFEVAKALREVHGAYRPLLIAVTGRIEPETGSKAHAAGIDALLRKPVPADVLLTRIAAYSSALAPRSRA